MFVALGVSLTTYWTADDDITIESTLLIRWTQLIPLSQVGGLQFVSLKKPGRNSYTISRLGRNSPTQFLRVQASLVHCNRPKSNPDLPVFGSLVQHKSSALDHATTEADKPAHSQQSNTRAYEHAGKVVSLVWSGLPVTRRRRRKRFESRLGLLRKCTQFSVEWEPENHTQCTQWRFEPQPLCHDTDTLDQLTTNRHTSGMTPLMYAVKDNRTSILDRMIDLGADVCARNNISTPSVRLLIRAGAL
uniref:Uncharacterized protein n=1 Tax=Timema tahoe TaxID=61484 RepID=A0A7R9FGA6_9NEOP|nr:unnamed protein product [Timema tahoe]